MEAGCENLPFLTTFCLEEAKQSQGNNLSFYLEKTEHFKMEGVFWDKQGTIPLQEGEERVQIKPKMQLPSFEILFNVELKNNPVQTDHS